MATSEVKKGLDDISDGISANEARIAEVIAELEAIAADYNEYPARYATLIAEVGAYAPTGAFESLCKDELGKLTAQYQVSLAKVNGMLE